jgi:hypothetical protein
MPVDVNILNRLSSNDPTLVTLFLPDRSFTDADIIQLFKALKGNTFLKRLNIGNYEIGGEGVIALAKNTTVTELKLTSNHIDNVSVVALSRNITITELDLGRNKISDEGRAALNDHYSDDSDEDASGIQAQLQSTLPHPMQNRRADKDNNQLNHDQKDIAQLQSGHTHVRRTVRWLSQQQGESSDIELEAEEVNKQKKTSLFENNI